MASAAQFADVRTVNQETAARWQDGSIPSFGKGIKGSACWTVDHTTYFSYSTCIATVDHERHTLSFNTTRYSNTTNRYARMLRYTLTAMYPQYWVFEADPGCFNVDADTLAALARGDQPDHIGDTVDDLIDVEDRMTARNIYGTPLRRKRNRSTLV